MPSDYVVKLAKEKGISEKEAETKWNNAKEKAAEQGQSDNYAYITSIFKNMMDENLVDSRVQKFLDSKETDFDRFLENLKEESPMMSSDFVAPEKVADEEDEDFESDILKVLDENVKYSYHSTQFNLDDVLSEKDFSFINLQNKILDESLVYNDHAKGKEDEIHTTLLYGIVNENSLFDIQRICTIIQPIKVKTGKVSLFTNADDYDVVKIDIVSPELEKLHYLLRGKIENNNSYPEYHPHITLAYVKKGSCNFLIGNSDLEGRDFIFDTLVFKHKDGYDYNISLGK